MKLYSVIKEVRAFYKRSAYVPKIISSIPILKKIEQIARVYSRVKEEEDKIIGYLSESKRPSLNLVCDLRCTPPTYGDFSAFLMAIRILSTKFSVVFIIVIDEFNSDWVLLGQETQIERVAQFKELAARVASASNSQLIIVETFEKLPELTIDSQIIFDQYVHRRKKIYWDLKLLNDVLFKHLGCTREVLLDRLPFVDKKIQTSKTYVLWHVRRSSIWSKEYDLSDQEFVDLYKKLREAIGFNVDIVVCSSDEGLRSTRELASKTNLEIRFSRDYSENFLGDVALLYGSLFFIQLGGGGMSEYAWSSSVPFLDINCPLPDIYVIYKRLFGVKVKSGTITSWQCSSQMLSTQAMFKRYDIESQLKLVYEECSVSNRGKI